MGRGALFLGLAVGLGSGHPEARSARLLLDNGADGDVLTCLTEVPLSTEGLASDPVVRDTFADPATHVFLRYLVECALAEGQALEVGGTTFFGAAGYAAEWHEGACGASCQERVTTCLLARTNLYELPVQIFMTTDFLLADPEVQQEGLDTWDAEYPHYSVDEGAFFGNYFTNPARIYACTGRGIDPFARAFRVCTRPGSPCGMQVVGPCGDLDGTTGEPATGWACEGFDDELQSWTGCHTRLSDADGVFPAEARRWDFTTTVHLAKGDLNPEDPACYDASP